MAATDHIETTICIGMRDYRKVNLDVEYRISSKPFGEVIEYGVYVNGDYVGKVIRSEIVERVPIARGSRIGRDLRPRVKFRDESNHRLWHDTRKQAAIWLIRRLVANDQFHHDLEQPKPHGLSVSED